MVWKGNNLIVSQKGIRKKFLIREIQAISSKYRGSNKLRKQDIKGKYDREKDSLERTQKGNGKTKRGYGKRQKERIRGER